MSYCFNLACQNPSNPLNINQTRCKTCRQTLLLTPSNHDVKYYRGIQLLGEGGFGKLIEVEDDVGRRQVLKSLRLKRFSDSKTKKRAIALFQQEAKVLSQLHHSGIPRVTPGGYFVWPEANRNPLMYCFVMEKIDGSNLQEWLSASGNWPLTQEQVIRWLKQLVEILEQIHRKNYLHRDIKPSNIMLRPTGQLVLIDFGAVRELTDTYLSKIQDSTAPTSISSYGYTPQEQLDGRAVKQSDLFALGRTFVHILTGKHPASEEFYVEPETGRFNWRIYAPDVSSSFAALIDALIEPSVGERPRNTQLVLERIEQIREDLRRSQQLVVIFQKPEQPEKITFEPENSPDQNPPKNSPYPVDTVIGDVVGEAVEREVSSAIVARRHISLENLIQQIQVVGLQRTIRQIREGLSNKLQHRPKVPAYIIVLLLILSVSAVPQMLKPSKNRPSPRTQAGLSTAQNGVGLLNEQLSLPLSTPVISTPASPGAQRNDGRRERAEENLGISPYIRSVIFSPNGKLIAISYADNKVQIRQSDTGILMLTIPSAKGIEFSPDGQVMAVVSRGEKVQLWDVKTGKLRLTLSREPVQ
jgi:serine/threonine protein kinase